MNNYPNNKSAVKCNPDPYVLRLLAALGTGFDCASINEIRTVLNINPGAIDPSRIIFANPCKPTSFIYNATRAGVDLMTFDNIDELHKIARVSPNARLVLRILTDDSKAHFRLGLKFGAPLASVPALLVKAKELSLNVIGVSFHVGSGCLDAQPFADALRRAREVFDMGAQAGYTFGLLDLGGGFEDAGFEAAASVLMNVLDELFPGWIRTYDGSDELTIGEGVRVIAEPGRFYVSTAFRLAVNVIARRIPVGDELQTPIDINFHDGNPKEKEISPREISDSSPRVMCWYSLALSYLISAPAILICICNFYRLCQ
jgi:ornithine decarboxylase